MQYVILVVWFGGLRGDGLAKLRNLNYIER